MIYVIISSGIFIIGIHKYFKVKYNIKKIVKFVDYGI